MSHTPGPKYHCDDENIRVTGPLFLCAVHRAAPDLLAALTVIDEMDPWEKITPTTLQMVAAVIRKAEGAC